MVIIIIGQSYLNSMNQLNQLDPHLQQQLASLTNAPWQSQIQIIQSLPHNLHLIRLINHRNFSSDIASLLIATNPRSKLVTVVVDFIVNLFSLYCNQLSSFANMLVSSECLLHLLGSGNKVVASAANQALKTIISNTDFKEKGKLIKYVHVLQEEFLISKISYVREKISLYFELIVSSGFYQTKDALSDFERKIVKPGLQDACQKVRKNMRKVLQNATNYEKQNAVQQIMRVSIPKINQESLKATNKSIALGKATRVIYSSLNQTSILQSFREETQKIRTRPQHPSQSQPNNAEVNQTTYRFFLERLKAGGAWSMVIIAYEEVINCITNGWLAKISNQSLYSETVKQMMPFLAQKRSKIYENCCGIFVLLLKSIKDCQMNKAISYLQENSNKFIEYAVRIESVGTRLLPLLIELKPCFFVVKLAEVSLQLKVSRQKIMVLDSILKSLPLAEDQVRQKVNKRVGALVKIMCQHVMFGNGKDREINFAALAIISHLKSRHPDQVLSTLLCQNDKVLTKIIQLAESIDQTLKQAVIEYIASFKSQKTHSSQPKSANTQQPFTSNLQNQFKLILQGKCSTLNNLGYLYLSHLPKVSEEQFLRLLHLLEHLNEKDMLMQLKIVLTQIAKQGNLLFLRALLRIISSNGYPIDPVKEHHILLQLQMLGIAIKCLQSEKEELEQVASVLISVYRKQLSLKIRNMTIQVLIAISQTILIKYANEKELQLIGVYRDHLFGQQDFSAQEEQQSAQYLTNNQPGNPYNLSFEE